MVEKYKEETLEKMDRADLIKHCLKLQQENWEFQKSYYVKPRRRILCRKCYYSTRENIT